MLGAVEPEDRRRRSPAGIYLVICALDGCDGASRLINSTTDTVMGSKTAAFVLSMVRAIVGGRLPPVKIKLTQELQLLLKEGAG